MRAGAMRSEAAERLYRWHYLGIFFVAFTTVILFYFIFSSGSALESALASALAWTTVATGNHYLFIYFGVLKRRGDPFWAATNFHI